MVFDYTSKSEIYLYNLYFLGGIFFIDFILDPNYDS